MLISEQLTLGVPPSATRRGRGHAEGRTRDHARRALLTADARDRDPRGRNLQSAACRRSASAT